MRKKFRLKPRRPRDLPNFPSIFNSPMIVLKDDFFRILSEKENRKTNQKDVEVKFTIYYNVFALPFGYDTLEIFAGGGDNKKSIKSINLYERLNSREQEVVSYISGVIKHAEDTDVLSGNLDGGKNRDAFFKAAFSTKDSINPKSKVRIPKISSKFPEINIVDDVAYLYSNSYYEDIEKANGNKVVQNVPLSSDYKKITSIVSKNRHENDSNYSNFQKACHHLIAQKKDPMQSFLKANFIKSNDGRSEISKLSQEEIEMFAEFIRDAEIEAMSLIDDNGHLKPYESDVSLVNSFSNLKKITASFVYFGFDINVIENITIALTRKDSIGEVIETVKANNTFRNQKNISKVSRVDDLGNYPISMPQQYRNDDDCLVNDIAIEKNQFDNSDIGVYSSTRVVSYDKNINSGFKFYDLKAANAINLMTTIDLPAIGDNILKRDIITNKRTGEIKVNSTVKPCKILGHYNRTVFKQQLSNIKTYVTTISRNGLENFPTNIIKIIGLTPEVKIHKVVCEPIGTGSNFRIPVFNSEVPEIEHTDPVADSKYKYKIYLAHIDGTPIEEPLSIIHRTLPRCKKGYKLRYNGVLDRAYASVSLETSLENIAAKIQDGLKRAFSSKQGTNAEAAKFYEELFAEKIGENLKNIGDILQLQVEYYYKSTGNFGKRVFLNLEENREKLEFKVPIENFSHTGQIVSYNLMISNPLDIVDSGLEKIQNKKTREIFLRRTAAYFNSFTISTGTLPVAVLNPKTGRTEYKKNSKFNSNDAFNNVTCNGGIFEVGKNPGDTLLNKTKITNLESLYYPDDGECIVSWKCNPEVVHPMRDNKHVDFFVVTAEVNGLEIPVTSHPFVNFSHEYKIRTFSFLGVTSKVKFKVYTVYSDYKVDSMLGATTVVIKDIKKNIQEVN